MLATYALITFCIPTGFLNVSRTNRMLSAFAIIDNLRFLIRTFPAYLEAWVGSSLLSLVSHLCIPFALWGVVWCYLGIVYCFNEIPLVMAQQVEANYLAHSWFGVFRTGYEMAQRLLCCSPTNQYLLKQKKILTNFGGKLAGVGGAFLQRRECHWRFGRSGTVQSR